MAVVTAVRLKSHPRLIDEVTVDPPSCAANTTTEFSASVGNARTDMQFLIPDEDLPDGLVWAGAPRCDTNGTVVFKVGNLTGSPIDPSSITFPLIAL